MAEKQVEVITREFVKALRSRNIRVEKAILFGSYATGQATPDSDIDIAVISPDFGKDYVEEAVMLKRISSSGCLFHKAYIRRKLQPHTERDCITCYPAKTGPAPRVGCDILMMHDSVIGCARSVCMEGP